MQILMNRAFVIILAILMTYPFNPTNSQSRVEDSSVSPLKVGVIGLVHTHVHWLLGRENQNDIEIVGIVEPNSDLANRYSVQHGYSMDIVYDHIDELLEKESIEAVVAFNTIYGHLEVVEKCAPKGIHVMVEKPLAVNFEHAEKMKALAEEHNIHLLTNYETSWYESNFLAHQLILEDGIIGPLTRIKFNTGHPGPIEIGCNEEFLEWLTDPVLNGGGALTDFGCYGANLTNWFLKGVHPESVTCLTSNFKPDLYPKVDDDAIILLSYPDLNVIIQASWNWSHNRKDAEFYGQTGYVICEDGLNMRILESEDKGPYLKEITKKSGNHQDPFSFLHDVIRGKHNLQPFEPSTLENNILVMKILEAAKLSSTSGKTIRWADLFPDN